MSPKLISRSNDRQASRSKGIKIIENRQIVPPSLPPPSGDEWRRVGKRGVARNAPVKSQQSVAGGLPPSNNVIKRTLPDKSKPGKRLVRPAVVTISNKSRGASYAEILSKAREKVSLKDLGISETVIRRALNGAIVIEVPGPRGKQLAGSLSSRLAEALGNVAKVSNPVATGELRI